MTTLSMRSRLLRELIQIVAGIAVLTASLWLIDYLGKRPRSRRSRHSVTQLNFRPRYDSLVREIAFCWTSVNPNSSPNAI